MRARTVVTAALAVVATFAVAAALALVVLSTSFHSVTQELRTAVRSVRIAHEVEIALLTHHRMPHGFPRVGIESELQSLLTAAHDHVNSPEELEILRDVERLVEAYFVAARRSQDPAVASAELDQAFTTVERLIDINAAQATAAEQTARRLDRAFGIASPAVAILLVFGIGAVLLWFRSSVVAPLYDIGDAMRRYGSGDRGARVPESGPAELRAMARQFNEMAASLRQRYEDQAAFLAGVAHDLRGPLSSLRLASSMTSSGDPVAEDAQSRVLAIVGRQVDRLERMVGDLLDAARIEAGELELLFEERDARDIARAVVDLHQTASVSHPIRLDVPGDPVPLECDPMRVEQVVGNLIGNAIKYSPSGGEIVVRVRQHGDDVSFAVTDQGIGMSSADLASLFTPFHRASSVRRTTEGVGLGLAVASRIVEGHGGRIEVESALGRGSTFRVVLPRARTAAQPSLVLRTLHPAR